MTELQAVNTIISYTGEDPFDAVPTGLMPTYDRAKVILDESVDSANRTLSTSYTITTIPNKLVDYIVKRACRGYYTRTVGFEEKGLEVILVDEKQSLGSAIHYIVDNMFTVASTYKSMVLDLGKTANSIEEAYASIDIALDKLNDIEVPSVLTGKKIEEYRLAAFQSESGSELGKVERDRIFKEALAEFSRQYIFEDQDIPGTYRPMLVQLSMQANTEAEVKSTITAALRKLNDIPYPAELLGTNVCEVTPDVVTDYGDLAGGVSEDDNYGSTGDCTSDDNALRRKIEQYRLAVFQLESGIELATIERNRILKSIAKANIGSATAFYADFILANIKGDNPTEVQDEIDAFEAKIADITVPTGLNAEEGKRYKLAVLQLTLGSELGKIEKDTLIKSITHATIRSVMVDAKYDIVKSNIAPLVDFTSVDSITNSITSIKEKLDAIAGNITNTYPALVGKTIVYEYALNKLLAETKDEIATAKEMVLIQSIAKLVIDGLSLTAEEKTVFMSMPIEYQNIKAIEDVSRNVNIIINALEESRKNILGEGWKFNTITTELAPDNSGYIAIPASHLVVDSTQNNDIIIRDHKLFNSTDLTYIFTESEEVTYIDDIPLDDLPQYMVHYIIETASLKTHIGILGEDANTQNKREGVQRARAEALRVDANNRDGNILENTYTTTLLDRENL